MSPPQLCCSYIKQWLTCITIVIRSHARLLLYAVIFSPCRQALQIIFSPILPDIIGSLCQVTICTYHFILWIYVAAASSVIMNMSQHKDRKKMFLPWMLQWQAFFLKKTTKIQKPATPISIRWHFLFLALPWNIFWVYVCLFPHYLNKHLIKSSGK